MLLSAGYALENLNQIHRIISNFYFHIKTKIGWMIASSVPHVVLAFKEYFVDVLVELRINI